MTEPTPDATFTVRVARPGASPADLRAEIVGRLSGWDVEAFVVEPADWRHQLLRLWTVAHDLGPVMSHADFVAWSGATKDILLGMGMVPSEDGQDYAFADEIGPTSPCPACGKQARILWDNGRGCEHCGRDVTLEEALATIASLDAAHTATTRRLDQAHAALQKISDIRDNMIGTQSLNWSEHVYPLVAVLDAAGHKGNGYEIAAKDMGTVFELLKTTEAECDELKRKLGEQFDSEVQLGFAKHELERAVARIAEALRANLPAEDSLIGALLGDLDALVKREPLTQVAADAAHLKKCPVCGAMAANLWDGGRGCEHCTEDASLAEVNALLLTATRRVHILERAVVNAAEAIRDDRPGIRGLAVALFALVKTDPLTQTAQQADDEPEKDHGIWVRPSSMPGEPDGAWWWPDGMRYEGTAEDARRVALGAAWADRQGRVYEARKLPWSLP